MKLDLVFSSDQMIQIFEITTQRTTARRDKMQNGLMLVLSHEDRGINLWTQESDKHNLPAAVPSMPPALSLTGLQNFFSRRQENSVTYCFVFSEKKDKVKKMATFSLERMCAVTVEKNEDNIQSF